MGTDPSISALSPQSDPTVNIYSAVAMLCSLKSPPSTTLMINGHRVTFLCDTGASTSVIKDVDLGLELSHNAIWVLSADGQAHRKPLSIPTKMTHCDTGRTVTASVIMSPECPINLVGRDLLQSLNLGVVPTPSGMIVIPHLDGVFLTQTHPSIYASLDIDPWQQTPTTVTTDLLMMANNTLANPQDEIPWTGQHVTIALLNPDLDVDFLTAFTLLPKQPFATDFLYTDRQSFSAATVVLPQICQDMFQMKGISVPHISLCKPSARKWKDIGPRLKIASECENWEQGNDGWMYSPGVGLWRVPVTYLFTGQPLVHPL
ncbi:uncharacterized protein LOC106532048 [Austrofundulus limnaeus]|uniref:Uncharacterized protein LOC106532048 n=1 Tax=Austrofundulus limnaeus TaxID=52670 RepID=A0A2I4CU20_AUSLI|nr:PREDICTED: uncharacterized protein LOC106532048 [Austrofundulus limnaeus]